MENTKIENITPKDEQIQLIIKDIETNFEQMKSNIIPIEIKEEINSLIDKFSFILKDQQINNFIEKLDNLNSIINDLSQKIKQFPNINEDSKKSISKIKKLMYQINSIESRPSIITKKYYNGTYKGDYLNGKREGKGIYTYNNGDIYEGEYKNDLKEGFGIYKYKNGDIYEGNYKEGNYEGKGIYKYHDGEIYNGEYKKDLRDGQGIYTYKNGNKYDGQWKEGKNMVKELLYIKMEINI